MPYGSHSYTVRGWNEVLMVLLIAVDENVLLIMRCTPFLWRGILELTSWTCSITVIVGNNISLESNLVVIYYYRAKTLFS